jgi:hypothetical protein
MFPLFKRLLLCTPLLLTTLVSASAQCSQKLSDLPAAPELLGFRLGMTREEIKAWVPQTVFGRKDEFGVVKTTINPYFDPKIDQSKFVSVRSISLDILDDKLTSLWIGFDETFKAKTIEDFVKLISQSLKVQGQWKAARLKGMQLKCADFQLFVSTVAGGPSFRILDTSADETVATRRAAKEEAEAATGQGEDEAEIVADKQSKTYYASGCKPATEIADQNRVSFKSTEEAEKAGFKLAKGCQPN